MKTLFAKLFNNRWFYIRKAIVYQSSPKRRQGPEAMPKEMDIVFPASIQNVWHLNGFDGLPAEWIAQFEERLKSNAYQLFVVRSGKDLAYFSWLTRENETDSYLRFNTHCYSLDWYLFHCYTMVPFRGKGLHRIATEYLIDHFASRGQLLWGMVYSDNQAARKAWLNAGMNEVAQVKSIGLFKLNKTNVIVSH